MTHEDLEARHAAKSDMCKKLEEKRAAKAELASQLGAEVDALKQECGGLRTQLSALQESHDRYSSLLSPLLHMRLRIDRSRSQHCICGSDWDERSHDTAGKQMQK